MSSKGTGAWAELCACSRSALHAGAFRACRCRSGEPLGRTAGTAAHRSRSTPSRKKSAQATARLVRQLRSALRPAICPGSALPPGPCAFGAHARPAVPRSPRHRTCAAGRNPPERESGAPAPPQRRALHGLPASHWPEAGHVSRYANEAEHEVERRGARVGRGRPRARVGRAAGLSRSAAAGETQAGRLRETQNGLNTLLRVQRPALL